MSDKKLSNGDICLKKNIGTLITVTKEDLLQIDDDLYQLCINLEHRAWECPFCGQSEEYYLVNGTVAIGCGGHFQQANGKQSNSCSKCFERADEWHSED